MNNCSSTATYEYTDVDVKNFSALEVELKVCQNKYQDNSNKESKFSSRCFEWLISGSFCIMDIDRYVVYQMLGLRHLLEQKYSC